MKFLRLSYLTIFRYLPVPVRQNMSRVFSITYTVGSVAVLESQDKKVLALVQRHRSGLSLPGGLVRRNETPRDALVREIWEELRLRIDVPNEPNHVLCDPRARRIDFIWKIQTDSLGLLKMDGIEVIGLRWVDATASDLTKVTKEIIGKVIDVTKS